VLFVISQMFRVFDRRGAIAALLIGLFISFVANFTWLILLLIFAISSHLATRAWFNYKKTIKVQEGQSGERGYTNVMYAALIGIFIASFQGLGDLSFLPSLPYFLLFAISFSVVNADTFASEIGVLDKKVYLITTFKRVTPGTNGGVSLLGTSVSVLGAFIIGLTYSLLTYGAFNYYPVLLITAFGFVGNVIDSLLGALFENRRILSKGQVNLFAAVFGTVLSLPLIL